MKKSATSLDNVLNKLKSMKQSQHSPSIKSPPSLHIHLNQDKINYNNNSGNNSASGRSEVKSKSVFIGKPQAPIIDQSISPTFIKLEPLSMDNSPSPPILAATLDRVLFNPGVHYLKDPRTGIYNFDSRFEKITKVDDFNFDCLNTFIPPSKDARLAALALKNNCRFFSSTSSMSPVLALFNSVIVGHKGPHLDFLSGVFSKEPSTFSKLSQSAVGVVLKRQDNADLISLTKESFDEVNVLSSAGQILEKFLTTDQTAFEKYIKGHPNPAPKPDGSGDAYYYVKAGDFLLRSQLDCIDDRLPQKTFDLKTRATLPIRMDVHNYNRWLQYKLKYPKGLFESFERELYDMSRSALMKYNFQVKIGNMDGLFVAYHNTDTIFGFQYLSRQEIDEILYKSTHLADEAFLMVLQSYNFVLNHVLKQYSGSVNLRLLFSLENEGECLKVYSELYDENNPTSDKVHEMKQFTFRNINYVDGVRISPILYATSKAPSWKATCTLSESLSPDAAAYKQLRKAYFEKSNSPKTSQGLSLFLRNIRDKFIDEGEFMD